MTDDSNRHKLRLLISACVPLMIVGMALLGPAGASASAPPASGGAGIDGVVAPGAPGSASVLQISGPLSVSGGGITLDSPPTALLNGTVSFTGTVAQAKAGETIVIERQGSLPGTWVNAASATLGSGGTFAASWHANRSGPLSVRAVLSSGAIGVTTARAAALAVSPALTLTVYRGAIATIFGPGFFGHHTACGERLTRATLGVANRTLPCGSMVALYYRGRELVVPVIDRGPYAHHASWDLTSATASALGIKETVRIGALTPPPAG